MRGKRGGQAGAAPTLPDEATIKALAEQRLFERGRGWRARAPALILFEIMMCLYNLGE